jgi:ADP-ribosylglycohydrolase
MASLLGTAVADALGDTIEHSPQRHAPAGNTGTEGLPAPPWRWTDDTEMACSVVHVLAVHGRLDVDALSESFVAHYDEQRNYGPGVDAMIREVGRRGAALRQLASETFGGTGSWGNGAAMRIAPLGAWYYDDPDRAAIEAEESAAVTHTHREGMAGAVAVAVAAAQASAGATPADMIDAVLRRTPAGAVHDGLRDAANLAEASPAEAAEKLGTGRKLSAPDTVPLALWVAAQHLDDYEVAVRTAASVAHDVDTVCAIAGGIVAGRAGEAGIPAAWIGASEPLPDWVLPD